jgi:hypothetical protein
MTVDSKATTGEREREICGATKKGNFGKELVFGMGGYLVRYYKYSIFVI